MFPHERVVNSIEEAQQLSRTRYFWIVNYLCDYSGFDFLWEPVPWQAHQRHAWASQWQKDSGTYLVPKQGYTDTNYHSSPIIKRLPDLDLWENNSDIVDFDYSWHPDYSEPPLIYQFGTQHQLTGGPKFCVEGGTNIKYVDYPRATKTSIDDRWVTPACIDATSFDYTWHPDDRDPLYIYQFGTQHQRTGGPQYCMPGATTIKYVSTPRVQKTTVDQDRWKTPDDIKGDTFDYTWHPDDQDPPYIYQFGTQHQRTGGPRYCMPGATTVKYVSTPRVQKTSVDAERWEIPNNVDTSSFDFTWHPDDQDDLYIYQFGTQHQRTGGPRYVVPGAVEVKYVDQIRIKADGHATPIYGIDHIDGNRDKLPECVKVGRFVGNYLDTLRRIADGVPQEHEFIWIVSSVCDYSDFDFSWHPEQWQASMLHVFASNEQKFGDTFYMHVPTFKDRNHRCELLEWYDMNFIEDVKVPRHAIPVYQHEFDSQVDALKAYNFTAPLVEFARYDTLGYTPAVNLWRQETRAVTPLTPGACNVVIPRDAQNFVKTQIYDYPKIDKSIANWPDRLLDIVFIANGEPCAEKHWQWLQARVAPYYGSLRLQRVDGVNGRAAAYKAAAAASETDWFFAVFAKLEVDIDFPWDWQPDRLQAAKHYIFHAKNPVNGLEYGHQAMIAYNKRLVMANPGKGLDFTLDDAHEVVPILSGVAQYNYTPWMAWRTAFREVLKLKASLPDMESAYRIKKWCAMQDPDGYVIVNEQYSVWGALDAIDYYDSVNGDFDELKKSYEWDWLASYAFLKRNLLPDQ